MFILILYIIDINIVDKHAMHLKDKYVNDTFINKLTKLH